MGQTGAPPNCAPTQPQTCPKGQTRAPAGCHAAPVKSPCTVAKLVGKTLPQAARLLIHAGCRVGHVIRPPARATGVLRVTKQAQPAGRHLPTGTYVGLAVAYRRR